MLVGRIKRFFRLKRTLWKGVFFFSINLANLIGNIKKYEQSHCNIKSGINRKSVCHTVLHAYGFFTVYCCVVKWSKTSKGVYRTRYTRTRFLQRGLKKWSRKQRTSSDFTIYKHNFRENVSNPLMCDTNGIFVKTFSHQLNKTAYDMYIMFYSYRLANDDYL